MKKLFLLLTTIVLSAGMVTYAEKAQWYFTWDQFCTNEYVSMGTAATYPAYCYCWGDNCEFQLIMTFNTANKGIWYDSQNNAYDMPAKGTYTVQPGSSGGMKIANITSGWCGYNSSPSAFFFQSTYYLYRGTFYVEEGADGPYIHTAENTMTVKTSSSASEDGYYGVYVGSPAVYCTIKVQANDNTYGYVGSEYKSGYVYANNRLQEYKVGSTYTLTATETGGVFVEWQKNGSRISGNKEVDVVIDNNATYTAIFTAANGGTITVTAGANGQVKLGNGSWGATFSSDYDGGDNVSIAAQANEGYLFYQWTDNGSNIYTTTPYAITVSGDNTYTAEFRRAYTLSSGANNPAFGSVSITDPYRDGKYYEGQSVTLTPTPANKLYSFTQWSDGNTDNPRIITVNSSTAAVTYTAQFDEKEAIQIIDDNGVLYHSSGYGFFEGVGNGYAFHFETYNAPISVTQNYTAIDENYTKLFASENWTNQVNIDFSTMTVSISRVYVTATMYVYMLESMFEDNAGHLYYVRIKAIGPMTADMVNTDANVNWTTDPGTFSSGPELTKVGDRRYRLTVEGGNFSGFSYGYDAHIDFILDDEDTVGGTISPGVYPITYTGESHTVAMAEYPSFSYTDSYSTSSYNKSFDGSYARRMYLQSGGNVGNIWWFYLCGGTVTVTKNGNTYNIAVDAISSAANPNVTYPSSYYTVKFNISGVPAPSITTYTATFYDTDGETILGTRTAEAGSTIVAPEAVKEGYTLTGWSPAFTGTMPAANTTYTAQWTATTYNLTYEGLEDATNTNPATYTIESETITLAAPGARDGYAFTGWTINGTPVTEITHGSTGDKTLTATWNAATTLDLYDNQDATYYNNIKALNGQTYDVTYHRSVKYESDNGNARWYTLCLPFDVDQSQLDINGLTGKVYEYRYAEGSADENDHVTFHFRAVKSPGYMHAGQGYLVKATGDMGPDFTFENVTLNTSADVVNGNVDNLKNSNAYKESGDIAIVGVLRSGTLHADGRKVMGLANNKIWYPHSSGNPMPAYRAYFYNPSASASVMPRVRIVVEGEGETELEVVDGELYDARGNNAGGDVRAPRKYIRNGVLIIERNGVRYDAQGKRL